jgi:tRNA nucleotidyltransferase (CCA-adding enzyme)
MAYDDEGGLRDFFGGRDDLRDKIIRCVGDPNERFAEDYLRMLRTYRFAAVLDFEIAEDVTRAIRAYKEKIVGISAERIRDELDKLLLSGNLPIIKSFFNEFTEIIFPEINVCYDTLGRTKVDLTERFAALFHNCENAEQSALAVLKRLKYDNRTRDTVRAIIRARELDYEPEARAVRRLLSKLGAELLDRCLSYQRAALPHDAARFDECSAIAAGIIKRGEPFAIPHLDVNGEDLIAAGVAPGKAVGDALAFLLERVIDEPNLNNKSDLIKIIQTERN